MRRGVRLGIDVGSVRVGVAASDPEGILAYPVATLARTSQDGNPPPFRREDTLTPSKGHSDPVERALWGRRKDTLGSSKGQAGSIWGLRGAEGTEEGDGVVR